MTESFDTQPICFKFPNIEREQGEFERVAKTFDIESSVLMFLANNGDLVPLDDNLWNKLENTDSNRLEKGDWGKVEEYSGYVERDWNDLKSKLESGASLDAPIVMQIGETFHLVSGNTRLMVARAKGITPTVLLFEVEK